MNQDLKLERFAAKEIQRNIHHLIIDTEDGGYVAFGQYRLLPVKKSTMFEVYNPAEDLMGKFGDKRTAISWCVADKFRQLKLAFEIKMLDNKKQLLSADLNCRQRLADSTDSGEFEEMVLTKMQPKVQRLTAINTELEKCLNSAKYLQLKGFQK
jgi:hypothetical protein